MLTGFIYVWVVETANQSSVLVRIRSLTKTLFNDGGAAARPAGLPGSIKPAVKFPNNLEGRYLIWVNI